MSDSKMTDCSSVASSAVPVYGFLNIKHEEHRPRADEALKILEKAVSGIMVVMQKHHWRICHLQEFYPPDHSLDAYHLSLRETVIFVRVRNPQSEDQLRTPADVVDTLLQELSSIETEKGLLKYEDILADARGMYAAALLGCLNINERPISAEEVWEYNGIGIDKNPEAEMDRLRETVTKIGDKLLSAREEYDLAAVIRLEEVLDTLQKLIAKKEGQYSGYVWIDRLRSWKWLCPTCDLFVGEHEWVLCPNCAAVNSPELHESSRRERKIAKTRRLAARSGSY